MNKKELVKECKRLQAETATNIKKAAELLDGLTVDEVCEMLDNIEDIWRPCVYTKKSERFFGDKWCDNHECGAECWRRYFERIKKEKQRNKRKEGTK